MTTKILFARIGYMRHYAGPLPDDERPVGGGSFNVSDVGHELYNFRPSNGQLYGYFQPSTKTNQVNLGRIDPSARDAKSLHSVLLIFVAPRPGVGQVIVGWYKDAQVYRKPRKSAPGRPKQNIYFASANLGNGVLLPESARNYSIENGSGKMGEANVCYPLDRKGAPKKNSDWVEKARDYVSAYTGENLLVEPVADANEVVANAVESALAGAKGQGFAKNAKERKALELHSMQAAQRHYKKLGFIVEDVSDRHSFDLLCKKGACKLCVEVKGTTTDGSTVVLTRNEVEHALNQHNKCELFILHSIKLEKGKASGGRATVLSPWCPESANLKPVSFIYSVSP